MKQFDQIKEKLSSDLAVFRKKVHRLYHDFLVYVHLSPLSLAEKCRITFGAAVLLILALALLLPYIWMGQLIKKGALDVGRAKSDILLRKHFQLKKSNLSDLAELDNTGSVTDPNHHEVRWIRFTKDKGDVNQVKLNKRQRTMVSELVEQGGGEEIYLGRSDEGYECDYVRIFQAADTCVACHNPQGVASPFVRKELIGAAVVRYYSREISKTKFINFVCIIVAGLIGGTGAIVAFYMITQRVILRPIRQLRAIANNVAEGNLEVRSAINTRDEYEKLSIAFNHMLDGIQHAQQKLRQANVQLDAKIAELSERNIELFKANQIKGEFLANMSHEFRTPLNAILGFAEIIREKPGLLKKEKGRRYAENIITSGNRLLNMINDLLDLAKTEAGKMQLHLEKTSVADLCEGTVGHFSALTDKEKISVSLDIDPDIPVLLTDAGKVEQILYNFLSNAVKFTPAKGSIGVRAFMVDDKHVRIAVSDTGCGIAEANREKIFEKFRQVDGSLTRNQTGSGLGLAISKELSAMLAGSIGMESEVGKGSTFWLEIPVTLQAEQTQQG